MSLSTTKELNHTKVKLVNYLIKSLPSAFKDGIHLHSTLDVLATIKQKQTHAFLDANLHFLVFKLHVLGSNKAVNKSSTW